MSAPRSHAIVLGASMAGLGAARALANHFEKVTVVERDVFQVSLSATLEWPAPARKGVPQADHAHGLLTSGYCVLDDYFPGMMSELLAAGATEGDVTGDFLWYQFGSWKLRVDCGLRGIVLSRPLLEFFVREHLRERTNVEILDGHDVVESAFDADRERVTGVHVRRRPNGKVYTLAADLVVDASGRGSRSPRWLERWGFGRVPETLVKVDVGYATAQFERHPEDAFRAHGAVIAATPPYSTRGAAVIGAEGDRWLITLSGALGDYPPAELRSYRDFARSLPVPLAHEIVRDRAPLTPIVGYRFAANRRIHYEAMRRFPAGFLVLGDAVSSFNPVYGQGMSVALLEARALDECLARGTAEANLSRSFFRRVQSLVDTPWSIATGEDMRFPQVEGPRPLGTAWLHRYMERAHRVASKDPVVLKRFFEVVNLIAKPSAMLAPSIAWRVLTQKVGDVAALPSVKDHGVDQWSLISN